MGAPHVIICNATIEMVLHAAELVRCNIGQVSEHLDNLQLH